MISSLIPELGMKLAGTVCDFTEPATWQNKLFFPVERIDRDLLKMNGVKNEISCIVV